MESWESGRRVSVWVRRAGLGWGWLGFESRGRHLEREDADRVGGAGAEEREGEELDAREQVEQRDPERRELPLHRAEAHPARLPQVLDGFVHDRRHADGRHVHDGLERVLHRPAREELGGRHVEAAQVVLDVLADRAQRRRVEGAALADERGLLEQRLRLGDLLEERDVDRLLLGVERGVRIPRQDREEQADHRQEVLDELRLVGHQQPDRADVERRADEEREVVEVQEAEDGGEGGRQRHVAQRAQRLPRADLRPPPPLRLRDDLAVRDVGRRAAGRVHRGQFELRAQRRRVPHRRRDERAARRDEEEDAGEAGGQRCPHRFSSRVLAPICDQLGELRKFGGRMADVGQPTIAPR